MSLTCTRRIEFDAAHRLIGHESRCRFVHGHRYALEVTVETDALDAIGRVIDFSVIKERIGGWINREWDHNLLLDERDRPFGEQVAALTGQTVYYLPWNPTAENLLRYLAEHILPGLLDGAGVRLRLLRLYETPNNYVEWKSNVC